MTTTKINIGLALSRNFDKVTLEMLDEPISHKLERGLISWGLKLLKSLRISKNDRNRINL